MRDMSSLSFKERHSAEIFSHSLRCSNICNPFVGLFFSFACFPFSQTFCFCCRLPDQKKKKQKKNEKTKQKHFISFKTVLLLCDEAGMVFCVNGVVVLVVRCSFLLLFGLVLADWMVPDKE